MTADMNRAMVAKASWRIVQKDEGLWCQVFEKKYIQHHSILDGNYNKHSSYSSTWSSVIHGAQLLRAVICWRVGNDSFINFWNEN